MSTPPRKRPMTLLDKAGDFEDAEDEIGGILADCADAAREVADAYNEAAEAMGSAGEQHTERAEAIESWCDELESPTWPDPPNPEDEEYSDDAAALVEAWDAWREEVLDEARSLVDGLEV
jgi:hypothetical protein